MPFAREEIEELFEEAQSGTAGVFPDLDEVQWLHTVDLLPGKAMTKLFRHGCGLCGTRGHTRRTCLLRHAYGAAFDKMRKAAKNKRYASKNDRREYRTAWQAQADLKKRVNQLRAGYVPKGWGKRWREARALLEKERAS